MNLQEDIQRIKQVMGLNESHEEYVNDLINKSLSTVWYHGSEYNIDKNDLDPLYRFRDSYKKLGGPTGSSDGSCGIFFGKDPKERSMTGALSYSKFDNTSEPYTQGFMYEMKLKPESKIKNDNSLHRIGKEQYDRLISEGIDALTNGSELNVLNPNCIEYFKKIDEWKIFPKLRNYVRGKIVGDSIVFNNEQEMNDFLLKELGEYNVVNQYDKTIYISKDENNEKGFIFGTERKWINDLI